jgi:hypothetical protein
MAAPIAERSAMPQRRPFYYNTGCEIEIMAEFLSNKPFDGNVLTQHSSMG